MDIYKNIYGKFGYLCSSMIFKQYMVCNCPDDKTAASVFYEKRRKNKREITLIIN